MKTICAWCGKDLGENAPLDNPIISHGICPDCEAEIEIQMNNNKPAEEK